MNFVKVLKCKNKNKRKYLIAKYQFELYFPTLLKYLGLTDKEMERIEKEIKAFINSKNFEIFLSMFYYGSKHFKGYEIQNTIGFVWKQMRKQIEEIQTD